MEGPADGVALMDITSLDEMPFCCCCGINFLARQRVVRDSSPRLIGSPSFSAELRRVLSSHTPLVDTVACKVDFGDCCDPGPYRLSARVRGVETSASSVMTCADALGLSLAASELGLDAGEAVVFQLSWAAGWRTLHVLPPLQPHWLCFAGLVAFSPASASASSLPPLATLPLRSNVARGVGLEIECLTSPSICEDMRSLLNHLQQQCGASTKKGAVLERCRRWAIESDSMIRPSDVDATERTIEDCQLVGGEADRARRLLRAAPNHSRRTEFKSPPPPHELSFSRGAAEEIRAFAKLLQSCGAAASSIHTTHATLPQSAIQKHAGYSHYSPLDGACDSGTAVHVHVNVRSATAHGTLLSPRELVRVVLNWVKYDLVTSRFTRAWMWREPSCQPLYALGPELTRRQGDREPSERASCEWDFPRWLDAARQLLSSTEFAALGEDEQFARMLGPRSAASELGRYCSLNLQSVRRYGTLEIRRFHGTLDGDLLVHWCHFCAAFVETFHVATPEVDRLLSLPLPEALSALSVAQEKASPDELMRAMADLVDPATAGCFLADTLQKCVPPGHAERSRSA